MANVCAWCAADPFYPETVTATTERDGAHVCGECARDYDRWTREEEEDRDARSDGAWSGSDVTLGSFTSGGL